MKRLALAVALACVLSGLARAGEMHPTGAVATPTPTPSAATVTGQIHSTGATVPGEIHPTSATPGDIPTNGATVPEGSSTLATIILTLISIVF